MSVQGAFILVPSALLYGAQMMASLSYESPEGAILDPDTGQPFDNGVAHFGGEYTTNGTTTTHYGQNWQRVAAPGGTGNELQTALAAGRFFPDETDEELEARLPWLDMAEVNAIYAAFAVLDPYTDRSIRLIKDDADLQAEFDPTKVTVILTETGMGGEVRDILARVGVVPTPVESG
jgi:Arginine/lysine/ornithine decarboxylases